MRDKKPINQEHNNNTDENIGNTAPLSKSVKWAGGIIAAILSGLVLSSFAVQRDTRDKAQYSYEAVKRIEKTQSDAVTKEQFIEYKQYQDDKLSNIEKDIDETKEGINEIRQDVKQILKELK
jgi:septal ring factor EnvC (AmiA/AmiB activator)